MEETALVDKLEDVVENGEDEALEEKDVEVANVCFDVKIPS